MASELYNVIDALSREKGIDPRHRGERRRRRHCRRHAQVSTRRRRTCAPNSTKKPARSAPTRSRRFWSAGRQVEDPQLQITLEDARKIRSRLPKSAASCASRKSIEGLGRIAAQLAKQVIFQKVREAERDTVFNEYIGRVNEVVNATVKRIEGPDVHLRPRQGRSAHAAQGAVAAGVVRRRRARAGGHRPRGEGFQGTRRGRLARRSRAGANLFQTEVPEIYDNTVVIRAIAREAGERTKIAVMSRDKDVDAWAPAWA
jgi:transcription termination/antitermination protein NusA